MSETEKKEPRILVVVREGYSHVTDAQTYGERKTATVGGETIEIPISEFRWFKHEPHPSVAKEVLAKLPESPEDYQERRTLEREDERERTRSKRPLSRAEVEALIAQSQAGDRMLGNRQPSSKKS